MLKKSLKDVYILFIKPLYYLLSKEQLKKYLAKKIKFILILIAKFNFVPIIFFFETSYSVLFRNSKFHFADLETKEKKVNFSEFYSFRLTTLTKIKKKIF